MSLHKIFGRYTTKVTTGFGQTDKDIIHNVVVRYLQLQYFQPQRLYYLLLSHPPPTWYAVYMFTDWPPGSRFQRSHGNAIKTYREVFEERKGTQAFSAAPQQV